MSSGYNIRNFVVVLALCLNAAISLAEDNIKEQEIRKEGSRRPNFVVLLVDDLGIADIGCFGNDTIKTPNVDRLASLGAKLNHNLAPESMCTPSRAATLTGRYAIRSGLAAGPGEIRVFLTLAAPGGIPPNETTVAKVLRQSGYKTGMVGKWHLGLNCHDSSDGCHHPLNMGFDEFYGVPLTNIRGACGYYERDGSSLEDRLRVRSRSYLIPLVAIVSGLVIFGILSRKSGIILLIIGLLYLLAFPTVARVLFGQSICVLMRGQKVVEQKYAMENLTVKFTNEANNFITKNKDNPFFLYMSYAKVHTSLFTTEKFKGHSVHGLYGDNVEEMDWSVGEIVSKLEEQNLLDNTFIFFTSDHGPYLEEHTTSGEYHGGWKGQYRGGKGQSYEGGIRVPTVATWKGHIPPGTVINEPTNTMDIFTTMIELAGANVPNDRIIDSKNILPLLTTEETISPHEFMFHYCGDVIHAVRYRPRDGSMTWKAFFFTQKWSPGKEECQEVEKVTCMCHEEDTDAHDPPLLFDITNDPYEGTPKDPSEHPDVIKTIREALKQHQLGVKPVPRQLGYPNAWVSPRLQPCCNPPFCSCTEE